MTVNTVGLVKFTSGMEIPVSACQLGAQRSPNCAVSVWNPSAFNEKRKQADNQRQPVGLQTKVRQGEGGRGPREMR